MRFCLLTVFVFLIGCKPDLKTHPIQFYYWKSEVFLGDYEKLYFNELKSEKLYIRLFDVVKKEGKIEPIAFAQQFDSNVLKAEFIPVIYFTNEVFQGIAETEVKKLAEDSFNLISNISSSNGFPDFNEIQIDCDWTESTKDNYFLYLKELKKIAQKTISSTLRLHQVKFKNKTGVPPADKVYLMCYATSSPIEEVEKNSILDLELLKDYLKNIDQYPIHFDVALPVYSWAIVTNHLGKKKLINAVSDDDLNNSDYKKLRDGLYEVQNDTFLKGIYLNKGFKIKVEAISNELLKEARKFLESKVKADFDIVYYHLDAQFLKRYKIEDLK